MSEITLILRILSLAFITSVRCHHITLVCFSSSDVLFDQWVREAVSISSPLKWNKRFTFNATIPFINNMNRCSLGKKTYSRGQSLCISKFSLWHEGGKCRSAIAPITRWSNLGMWLVNKWGSSVGRSFIAASKTLDNSHLWIEKENLSISSFLIISNSPLTLSGNSQIPPPSKGVPTLLF